MVNDAFINRIRDTEEKKFTSIKMPDKQQQATNEQDNINYIEALDIYVEISYK